MTPLPERVAAAQRSLTEIYRLELRLRAADFLMSADRVQALLPEGSPRTGVVVVEHDGELHVGLYVDPDDMENAAAIVEETSHLLYLAWHAERGRGVSRLHLELQGEVDRYAVARISGGEPLRHFRGFRWADWMGAAERLRYETAHRAAHRYCRSLEARFPRRADTPALLAELRRFYRSPMEQKLPL
ncbi:MAG: hypothetical protein QNK04_11720 [Myxococcota bacterium]|nr:hypothetical protein [Myxococcota bacterium]